MIGLIIFILLDLARTAYGKSRERLQVRDELELRVQEQTAELLSSNKKLEDEIQERKRAEESLRELAGRLLRLKDEEQRRIARELHDSTAHILGAVAITLESAQQFVLSGQIWKPQKP